MLTGANQAKYAEFVIKELVNEGAKVSTIPTDFALRFIDIDKLKKIDKNIIKIGWDDKIRLPKEDAILIAPCTFNTLNSIASGIANTYPLCLIASAIGKKTPVFIAPAMNKSLWDHPIVGQSIKILENWGCRVIWPKISRNKVTMIDRGKILDTVFFSFSRVNYNNIKESDKMLYNKLLGYRNKYFDLFLDIGKYLFDENLNLPTAGCISVRVKEGYLVTSTGCELSELRPKNISMVNDWQERKNLIRWVGDLMPSSESPLHCILQQNTPYKIILHFHCPQITYNDKYLNYNTKEYYRYGTFKIGREIMKKINSKQFCILRYHGEVVLANSNNELLKNIDKLKNI